MPRSSFVPLHPLLFGLPSPIQAWPVALLLPVLLVQLRQVGFSFSALELRHRQPYQGPTSHH